MKNIFSSLFVSILIVYPFLVFTGLKFLNPKTLGAGLLVLTILRIWFLNKVNVNHSTGNKLLFPMLIVLYLGVIIFDSETGLKFQPVLVNLLLLLAFGYSLMYPPSMVERFARIKRPVLSPKGVIYTRKVTQLWCAFFFVNGSIALCTINWGTRETWVIYNGFVSYLLMGLLFLGEYFFRQVKMKSGI